MRAELEVIYDSILEEGIATSEEMSLVLNILGVNEEAFDSIVRARTEFRTMEQYKEFNP